MSVAASSSPCIKFSTCSPSCSCSSSSSLSTKPYYVNTTITIRNSQTEGPIRRPAAPSPPTLKPPTPPSKSPSPPPQPQPTALVASGVAMVEGKNVVTLEFQWQKAKEVQDYFKQKKLEEANQGPFFGFVGKNEISNGS